MGVFASNAAPLGIFASNAAPAVCIPLPVFTEHLSPFLPSPCLPRILQPCPPPPLAYQTTCFSSHPPYSSATLAPSTATTRAMSKKRAVNVVLLEDLALRGFAGEEVAVKPGYARNFLIPGRKAVYATADNKAQHVVARSDEERGLLEERRDFVQFKARATHRALTFTRKVTLDGTSLEQPLTKAELAAAVRKQLKRRVEETDIRLPRGTEVKVLGDLEIKVEVGVPQLLLMQEQQQQQQEGGAATAAGEKKGGIKEKREAVSVKVTIQKDETKRDRRVSGGTDAEGGGKPTE